MRLPSLLSRLGISGLGAVAKDPERPSPDVDALSGCRDLTDLRRHVAGVMARHLGCRRTVVFEPASGGDAFAAAWCDDPGLVLPAAVLRRRGAFARWLRVNAELLQIDREDDLYLSWPPEEREVVDTIGATLCLPFVAAGELVAFAAGVGHGASGQPRDRRAPDAPLDVFARHAAARWRELDRASRAERAASAMRRSQQLTAAGQLAATVSHEVRNPLATVRSLVQSVRDTEFDNADQTRILGMVIAEVDRIADTLERHLDLGRLRTYEAVEVDLGSLADAVVRFVQPYARRQRVILEHGMPDEPLRVMGDPAELRQVLINLLLNACQACEGQGRVVASTERGLDLQTRKAVAQVAVVDNGRGIAPANVARLFEPFFTTKKEGAGLGLAFCRDALTRCGGEIRVSSGPGQGTRVTVTIPLVE